MDKHDKHFGIALLISVALSALIVVGAQTIVGPGMQTATVTKSVA